MSARWPSRLAAGLLLALLAGAGARRLGPLPALGPFLDPAHGIWTVATTAILPAEGSAHIPGLTAPVEVRYDDRGVPHIFAAGELDAVRALGYVVARDRLFQLDLQTLAGSGRLTELAGARALPRDREMRGLGLPRAADRALQALAADPAERDPLTAFAQGVNAWIDRLGPRDLPFEYHLLGRRPERWAPINSLHLLNRMGWTLANSDDEQRRALARGAVGDRAAEALFPVNSPIQEPIQPGGRPAPWLETTPLPPPGPPDLPRSAVPAGLTDRLSHSLSLPDDAVGSNNWAVAPRRTAAGFALLAGDPHLDLTLPSIWYEIHLVVPDSLDVYGATIPGAPGVIIGFTRDVAWSVTNAETDVLDRYREEVDDTLAPSRYRLDGAWRPLEYRVERYLGPDGRPVAVDTLRFTHRGPLQHNAGGWVSIRWTVLEQTSGLSWPLRAARATTVRAALDTIAGYQAPPQNFVLADRGGTIAIRSTGRIPLRPGDGRGDVVRDGRTSASDWTGDWTPAEYPQSIAPAQGFLASANQQPVDPVVEPRYLGANWISPWRALRINHLLRADSAVTPDAMRRYQTDPVSSATTIFRPELIAAVRRFPERDSLQRAAALLEAWDGRYTVENTGAVLYQAAIEALPALLWDELDAPAPRPAGLPYPAMAVVVRLLHDPDSPWWDDRRTPDRREDRDLLLARALEQGYARVLRDHGAPEAGGWRWDRVHTAAINHLLGIPALSVTGVPVQGGPTTLSPSASSSYGASWRMVVELGPEVRAWGTYPGGQSGNPASPRYQDRIGAWSAGLLDTLRFPRRPGDLDGRVTSVLRLEPAP